MAYDPAPQANAMAALRFDPQMNAINRQITDLQNQTASNNTGIDTYNTQGIAGTNSAYDTLGQQHDLLSANAQKDMHTVGDQIGQTWKDATAVQQANRDQSNQQLSDYASRFGLQSAALPAMSALDQQIQKMITTNSNAGATQQGAADTYMSGQKSFFDAWKGIDQASRAKELGDFATAVLQARSANQLAGLKGQNDLYGKLNDTMGQRNAFLTDEMNQLTQADWDREFKTDQAQWQRDVENNRIAAQAAKDAKDESLGWAQLFQGGMNNETQNRIAQENADTNQYAAHIPKDKPYNDLDTAKFVYQMASNNGQRTPTAQQLEQAWNQAAATNAVNGTNPYFDAAQKERDAANQQNNGGGGGGFWNEITSAFNPFATAPNPLNVPTLDHNRANDFLSKLGRWGSPWSRGNPFS